MGNSGAVIAVTRPTRLDPSRLDSLGLLFIDFLFAILAG
jgi:hypothetical protein